MKQFKLTASILIGMSLFSSAAFAHVSLKGEMMSDNSPANYDWTGFYTGFNMGAMSHTMSITDNQATTFNATIQQVLNPKFTGGLQIGYRNQLNVTKTSGVYGVEFSANFPNVSFHEEYGSPFAFYQLDTDNKLNDILLLEFIGGIAADRTLLFLAAGLSWTNITGSVTNVDSPPFFNLFSLDKKAIGTALGGGIEYAFNEKISVRLKVDVITPKVYSTWDDTDNSFQISNSIVQGTLGINYKLG